MERLKIAIVGSGAIGSYYGGLLARKGEDVHFLMRRDLAAVREGGLRIRQIGGEFHLPQVNAWSSTEEIGPVDLVLVGLKTTSNDALGVLIPPLLKENTVVLTLQNGLGNEEFLASRFGAERILGGLCFICLNRVAPGVVENYSHGSLAVGQFQGALNAGTHKIVELFSSAGANARLVQDLLNERWRKLVWNVPFNGLSIAAGRITVDEILADPGLACLARHLMKEVVEAAGRLGHFIEPDYIEQQIQRTYPMGAYKPSSLIDYMEGRPVEVEAIWGEPLRQATSAGLDCGRLETLYFLLKQLTKSSFS